MKTLIDRRAAADLAKHFNAIQKLVPLHPIRSDSDYDAAVTPLNSLLDVGAADESHPVAMLAATLGELIADRHRRELNLRQIRALAKRFSVPAAVFVEAI